MQSVKLSQAEKMEVTILVDNYSDLLLQDTDTAKRMKVMPPQAPMAEHGLACLISVYAGEEKHTILMDAGITGTCLLHNADLLPESMGVKTGAIEHQVASVEAVVLSHGHFDHYAGLPKYLVRTGKQLPLVVHPGAFVDRRIKFGPDFIVPMPTLIESDLQKAGAIVDKRAEVSTIAGDMVLVTGQVARVTDFETGSPGLEARIEGQWIKDPFADDQGIAIHLRDKGLVVMGGCSHSGIINITKHAMAATGVNNVYAILGGFHLAGPSESFIEPTVAAMKALDPEVIVPMHCTGWMAINRFAEAMPDQFILNSVGTTYQFGG
jgi:7,8-dihydropterin-6-yl-methyl-4-(beta-D-ribofuranosyl)aminobenzene 5'-phosphate synthase